MFRCEECGGKFQEEWTDEEANAEAYANFGVANASVQPFMAVVCDDCYKAMMDGITPEMFKFLLARSGILIKEKIDD